MINRAVLTGRMTKDPELKNTQSGTPVLAFTLAVDRNFKKEVDNAIEKIRKDRILKYIFRFGVEE